MDCFFDMMDDVLNPFIKRQKYIHIYMMISEEKKGHQARILTTALISSQLT